MTRIIALSISLGFALVSCAPRSGSASDAEDIYEAALAHEIGEGTGAGTYIMVDGSDPAPAMLERIQKRWPEAKASSAKPKEKPLDKDRPRHISIGELKWIDRYTAEVKGGFSNGMDGRYSRHRLVRKAGAWSVEKSTVEAIS